MISVLVVTLRCFAAVSHALEFKQLISLYIFIRMMRTKVRTFLRVCICRKARGIKEKRKTEQSRDEESQREREKERERWKEP